MKRLIAVTLPEAIEHANEVAGRSTGETKESHLQLANWLTELQNYKEAEQLDTAIMESQEMAQELQGTVCGMEHQQLADWLTELKTYRKKRLVAITNGALEDMQVSIEHNDAEDMLPLKTLDSAQVKNNKCPNCQYSPLEPTEGYKVCKNCGSAYKIFDNEVFLIQ